jgi:hypothetical protein
MCGEISRSDVKRQWLPIGILLAMSSHAGVNAIEVQLTQAAMQRATELARWPHTDAERAQFHKRYTIAVNGPLVEYFAVEKIEVTTPFRRLELIAEDHARINDLFARGGLRDAEEALRPWRDQVAIAAYLRFDFTKVIPGVPDAEVTLEGPGFGLPITSKSSEIYTFNGDQRFLVGGLVEAVFDVRAVSQTTQPVIVSWHGKELARAVVNFGAIE